jgi:hypothetical protein
LPVMAAHLYCISAVDSACYLSFSRGSNGI